MASPGVRTFGGTIDFSCRPNEREDAQPPNVPTPQMRRLLALVAIAASLGCGSDLLGPVQSVDGNWNGIQNGYSMSLALTQTGTTVSGTADFLGVGGQASGSVSGTFVYPTLDLTITIPQVADVSYKGTMSGTQAKIFGQLNGSGFVNLELDVHKK
jgi:hypothetical protein